MIGNQKALSPFKRLENIVRRAIKKSNPGFAVYDSVVYAKVLKANFKGGKVDIRGKGYSVNVQVLNKDLTEDSSWKQITDVPLDPATFGEDGVVYTVPKVGAIVRLAFMYNDPSFPYIQSITAENQSIPEGSANELRIEIGEIAFQIKKDSLIFRTKNYNTDMEVLIDKILNHTHLGNMGAPTSPTSGSIPPGLTLPIDFKGGGL